MKLSAIIELLTLSAFWCTSMVHTNYSLSVYSCTCYFNILWSKDTCFLPRRQQNYLDILKGLNLGHKSAYDLTHQFHHVFWFGDLNYRIDLEYEVRHP